MSPHGLMAGNRVTPSGRVPLRIVCRIVIGTHLGSSTGALDLMTFLFTYSLARPCSRLMIRLTSPFLIKKRCCLPAIGNSVGSPHRASFGGEYRHRYLRASSSVTGRLN